MQLTRIGDLTVYDINFALDEPSLPLQVQIADNALPNINEPKDCVAALMLWATRVQVRPVQQLKIASRAGSSLVSIEVYAKPNDPIDEMLFVLIFERGRWDYCSPAQESSKALKELASTLKEAISPCLKERVARAVS